MTPSESAGERAEARLRVALGQYDTGWHDPTQSLARAGRVVARAAGIGAQLVVLPEMATTGFTMESTQYAEPLEGESVTTLSRLAAQHRVHLLVGVATKERLDRHELCYNSALLFGPRGESLAHYRKQQLFAIGGEDVAYEAGRSGVVVDIKGVRIAPFVCYDLRFPELFRAVAPEVDALILIANWPVARRAHWDVLVQARAIENQCYFIAVNRVGSGGGADYDGGSAAYGPWGDRLCDAGDTDASAGGDLCCVTIDSSQVTRVRSTYPFSEDRRGAPRTRIAGMA